MLETTVDIKQIMQEIRAQAATFSGSLPEFNPTHATADGTKAASFVYQGQAALASKVQLVRDVEHVLSERPIGRKGGLAGKLSTFVKQLMRKFMRFYIVPIVDDQNRLNSRNTVCLQEVSGQLERLERGLADVSAQAKSLDTVDAYTIAELEAFVRQTQERKITLLERQAQTLAQANVVLQAQMEAALASLEAQEKSVSLLQYQCAVLEKKAALAQQ